MDQRRSTITLFHKQNDMYNGERLRHSFFGFGSARMKLARRTERRRFGGDDNQAFVTLRRCCGRRSVSSLFTKNARLAFRRASNVHRPACASRRSRETSARGLMPVMMRAALRWQHSRRAQSDFGRPHQTRLAYCKVTNFRTVFIFVHFVLLKKYEI